MLVCFFLSAFNQFSTHMLSFKNNCSNMMFNVMQSKHQSLIEPRRPNHFGDHNEQPPPLPVKKKHSKFIWFHFNIMIY